MTRFAEAVLQAEMVIRSSSRWSLTLPPPDWMMKTSLPRTDSSIWTLVSPFENLPSIALPGGSPKWLQMISVS